MRSNHIVVATMVAFQHLMGVGPAVASHQQLIPLRGGRELQIRVEKALGRTVPPGNAVQVRASDLGLNESKFSIGPVEQETAAIGCTAYWAWLPNPSTAPCSLFVESFTLSDPGTGFQQTVPIGWLIAPGWAIYGTYAVGECATHLKVRYQYQCPPSYQIVQDLNTNYGWYGFTWWWTHVTWAAQLVEGNWVMWPPGSTVGIWELEPNRQFCLGEFHQNGSCSGPPGQVTATNVGITSQEGIPTVSQWGLVVMGLLVASAATVVIMRRRAVAFS
jgi:hypothetical protein